MKSQTYSLRTRDLVNLSLSELAHSIISTRILSNSKKQLCGIPQMGCIIEQLDLTEIFKKSQALLYHWIIIGISLLK